MLLNEEYFELKRFNGDASLEHRFVINAEFYGGGQGFCYKSPKVLAKNVKSINSVLYLGNNRKSRFNEKGYFVYGGKMNDTLMALDGYTRAQGMMNYIKPLRPTLLFGAE